MKKNSLLKKKEIRPENLTETKTKEYRTVQNKDDSRHYISV